MYDPSKRRPFPIKKPANELVYAIPDGDFSVLVCGTSGMDYDHPGSNKDRERTSELVEVAIVDVEDGHIKNVYAEIANPTHNYGRRWNKGAIDKNGIETQDIKDAKETARQANRSITPINVAKRALKILETKRAVVGYGIDFHLCFLELEANRPKTGAKNWKVDITPEMQPKNPTFYDLMPSIQTLMQGKTKDGRLTLPSVADALAESGRIPKEKDFIQTLKADAPHLRTKISRASIENPMRAAHKAIVIAQVALAAKELEQERKKMMQPKTASKISQPSLPLGVEWENEMPL